MEKYITVKSLILQVWSETCKLDTDREAFICINQNAKREETEIPDVNNSINDRSDLRTQIRIGGDEELIGLGFGRTLPPQREVSDGENYGYALSR